MADRPCRLRLQDCLLTALLLSISVTAHAVGIATPQVMSGFNEPLKARVALLDTGTLRASDIRATLADSDRWQAMDIARSADTDTLQLAVNGVPGHLYLDVEGSRVLEAPWLDVVLTLRWPQGELTPQLTLLPSNDAAAAGKAANAAASLRRSSMDSTFETAAPAANRSERTDTGSRVAQEVPVQDSRLVATLEARLERLEQQLRSSQQAQVALTADLESIRAQVLVDQPQIDNAEMQALALRQQALEARMNQLNQVVPAPDVSAPAVVSAPADVSVPETVLPRDASPQAVSPQGAPVVLEEQPGSARDNSFVWVYALAALVLLSTAAWALVRRWRQARYRLVSAAELSPMGDAYAGASDVPTTETGENQQQVVGSDAGDAWAVNREHIDAICNEAEVFQRHNRRDHAIAMLQEGLDHYPNDFQLVRALAALEAGGEYVGAASVSTDDDQPQPLSVPPVAESPTLAPLWSLQSGVTDPGIIGPTGGDTDDIASGRAMNFATTPTAAFPQGWALEEVAFEAVDTDNERPHADRLSRHA